jgi:flagellar hook-associated protein 1 FlgK
VSGVNLDEEAANLVRLQQAYQAAAQVVRVADSLFDTLLGAIGR